MNRGAAIKMVNLLASNQIPFLLITDFKCKNNQVIQIREIDTEEILYDINGIKNFEYLKVEKTDIPLMKKTVCYEKYKKAFDQVHHQIAIGNTYLLNLTFPTVVDSSIDLKTIFYQSQAKYKLWYKNQFVVFSPEIFIKIDNGQISSYPMKGTIDANLPGAREVIMSSEKEMAEHATIVDLIRNDMSIHAKNVRVEKFRYFDEIKTNEKHLLQVSSKISGNLKSDNLEHLGEIIFSLLPAGSICGAPKKMTLEIIDRIENYDRGFYTGIVGFFDGQNFDSGVMIRFIERSGDQLVYKSGGGIHFLSDPKAEYQEMIDKVYVPIY